MQKLHLHAFQFVLLAIIFLAGIFSIVATSIPPPDLRALEAHPRTVCKNDEATLIWIAEKASKVTLSASPLGNLIPKLDEKEVENKGRLRVNVLGETKIDMLITDKSDVPDLSISAHLELVPENICASLIFNPIGFYEGEIQFTSPNQQTLEKWLDIGWSKTLNQFLAELKPKEGYYDFRQQFTCGKLTANKELRCIANESNSLKEWRVILEGKFTGNDFKGTYKREGQNPEEGTFSFTRL